MEIQRQSYPGARRAEARPAETHPDVAGVEPSEGNCRSTMHVRRPEQLPGNQVWIMDMATCARIFDP